MDSKAEADKDGHVGTTVTLPDGFKTKYQFPLMDRDGDDMPMSEIKKAIFKEFAPDLNPQNYNLILEKDGKSITTVDDNPSTAYHEELFLRFAASFKKRQ